MIDIDELFNAHKRDHHTDGFVVPGGLGLRRFGRGGPLRLGCLGLGGSPTGGQRQHERSYHDEAKGLEGMIHRYKMRVHVSPFWYSTLRGMMRPWERNSPSTRTVPAM